jgi:hypothetical protein
MTRKQYLKKIGVKAGFDVWLVNGYFIRKNLNREFTNYGQHYRFEFIPEDEFWIDSGHTKKEIDKFVKYLLIENRLMDNGMSYSKAVDEVHKIEKSERQKHTMVQRLQAQQDKEKAINRVHKRLLKDYSGEVEVWLVRGNLVRSFFFIDFTQGGHDKVYNFVPRGEVWIDDALYYKEIPYVVLHELYERRLMLKNKKRFKNWKKLYDWAHEKASETEYFHRHHPNKLAKRFRHEIKLNTF